MAAKSTTTMRHIFRYQPHQAATQTLFNRVCAFYFEVIQRGPDLSNKEALTVLERLTHSTQSNPAPVMALQEVAQDIPAMFRRAAINAALGSARSFFTHLSTWRKRKEKALAKGKTFTERPAVPPRTWNKSVPFYVGQWKERTPSSILLKIWTGTCWSWLKIRITGRELSTDAELGSPSLIRRGKRWWLHTPVEKRFARPAKIEQQVTTNRETTICAVDLNLDDHLAVCTIQTVEGTILATRFIGHGREISGFRKKQLGRIARNRKQTGIIAENEQDNVDLWNKIKHGDEQIAHLISNRIVQFAKAHEATILVFEHLGNLKPTKGRYSKRGNEKRAYWMKGRIFVYAKYKAWNEQIITSRVNPRNTSRECARCHGLVARSQEGQPAERGLYAGCSSGSLSAVWDAGPCRSQCQSADRTASHRPRSRTTQGKASCSRATCREDLERDRCCAPPGSQTRTPAIYRPREAWRPQRAWHRPAGTAQEG